MTFLSLKSSLALVSNGLIRNCPIPIYQLSHTNFTKTLDRQLRRGIIQPAVFIQTVSLKKQIDNNQIK